jgi:hypothetical protein
MLEPSTVYGDQTYIVLRKQEILIKDLEEIYRQAFLHDRRPEKQQQLYAEAVTIPQLVLSDIVCGNLRERSVKVQEKGHWVPTSEAGIENQPLDNGILYAHSTTAEAIPLTRLSIRSSHHDNNRERYVIDFQCSEKEDYYRIGEVVERILGQTLDLLVWQEKDRTHALSSR